MKMTIKTTVIALALSAAVIGTANANVTDQSLDSAVQSAITSGHVNVRIDDGVATLFGWVESSQEEQAVKQAALKFDNVDSVVDLIAVSN